MDSRSGAPYGLMGLAVIWAFAVADPRWPLAGLARVVLGVAPLSCVVGFVTPALIDRFSLGDPRHAGIAYALNVAGCVAGPIVAGFALLPWLGERFALLVLAAP